MIGGEFDLSIGSTIGACGMILALLSVEYGWNIWLAAFTSLVFALLVGVFNGFLVLRPGLPSFIITLGTLLIIRGVTIGITRNITGRTVVGGLDDVPGFEGIHAVFARSFTISGASFSVAILWWLGVAAVATWVLMRTSFGNWIFGVGGNVQAARNVGVPVSLVKLALFMATATSAWLVAMHPGARRPQRRRRSRSRIRVYGDYCGGHRRDTAYWRLRLGNRRRVRGVDLRDGPPGERLRRHRSRVVRTPCWARCCDRGPVQPVHPQPRHGGPLMSSNETPLIEVQNVSKYFGHVIALKDISDLRPRR